MVMIKRMFHICNKTLNHKQHCSKYKELINQLQHNIVRIETKINNLTIRTNDIVKEQNIMRTFVSILKYVPQINNKVQ
jgi:hypothetical protein